MRTLEYDMMAGVKVGVRVGVGASEDVVRLGTEALGIVCVEKVASGDAEDGGCDETGVDFERTSDC